MNFFHKLLLSVLRKLLAWRFQQPGISVVMFRRCPRSGSNSSNSSSDSYIQAEETPQWMTVAFEGRLIELWSPLLATVKFPINSSRVRFDSHHHCRFEGVSAASISLKQALVIECRLLDQPCVNQPDQLVAPFRLRLSQE